MGVRNGTEWNRNAKERNLDGPERERNENITGAATDDP